MYFKFMKLSLSLSSHKYITSFVMIVTISLRVISDQMTVGNVNPAEQLVGVVVSMQEIYQWQDQDIRHKATPS